MPQVRAAVVLLATFQTPRVSWARPRARVVSKVPRGARRSSPSTSTPPARHRRDIRHRRGAPCRPARTMPLAPCLGPFVVPANCAVSATPPSRTCVRIDRSVVAVPPRRHRACSRRDLPHQHAIDATHFEARLAAPSRLSIPLVAVDRHGCGLRSFARLDVRRGLRRVRAGNAPVP